MSMSKHTLQDIVVHRTVDAIRMYPERFIGSISTHSMHDILYKTVQRILDPVFANQATFLHVQIEPEHRFTFTDNGHGIPIIPRSQRDPRPVIECILTEHYAGGTYQDVCISMSF